MKRVAISIIASSMMLSSLSAVEIESGWNLVGLSSKTTISELKSLNSGIAKVYIYEGDSIGYVDSGDIGLGDGIWIYANSSFELVEPKSETRAAGADTISLQKGWNLIALPVESTITPRVFDVSAVYKYKDGEWSAYSRDDLTPPALPGVETIVSGEGFWVYSEEAQEVEITKEESKLTPFSSKEEMDGFLESMVRYNKNYRGGNYYYYPMIGIDTDDMAVTSSAAAQSSESGSGTASTNPTPASETAMAEDGSSNTIDDTTGTNTQESDVDEADILKHDGNHIFYLPQSYSSDGNKIYISSFEKLLSGDSEPITSIALDSKPSEMYLINDKLITIYPYNTSFWGYWDVVDFGIWSEKSTIEVYDVSDINAISKVETFSFDGNIVDTRVTNGKLYAVTRFMPYITVEYPKTYVECNETSPYTYYYPTEPSVDPDGTVTTYNSSSSSSYAAASSSTATVKDVEAVTPTVATTIAEPYYYYDYNDYDWEHYCGNYMHDDDGYYKYDYENPIEKESHLTPEMNSSKGAQELLEYASTYAPGKVDQSAFITTISAFDLDDLSRESVSAIGDSSTLYASSSAIYLTSEKYPLYYSYADYKVRTAIYKFGIKDGLSYDGNGFVDGRILNQFSLSENNDILRIATTTGWSWMDDTDNMIYTLKNEGGELVEQGSLSGLGKEGETIQGVRFLGDKGFVVTFKQTDPLYTIDLSDPANPTKVGELEISGYSSYFHPVSDDLIMSVGMEADEEGRTQAPMIQLFDISDFSAPTLLDKVVLGDTSNSNAYYYSEAVNDHKAFSYIDSDRLFALPISYYDYTEYRGYLNYMSVYKIEENAFSHKGDLNSTSSDYMYGGQRGVIFSNDSKDYVIYFDGENLNLGEIK